MSSAALQGLSPALVGLAAGAAGHGGLLVAQGVRRAPYRICRPAPRPGSMSSPAPSRRLWSRRRGIAPGTSRGPRRVPRLPSSPAERNSRRKGARKPACPGRRSCPCSSAADVVAVIAHVEGVRDGRHSRRACRPGGARRRNIGGSRLAADSVVGRPRAHRPGDPSAPADWRDRPACAPAAPQPGALRRWIGAEIRKRRLSQPIWRAKAAVRCISSFWRAPHSHRRRRSARRRGRAPPVHCAAAGRSAIARRRSGRGGQAARARARSCRSTRSTLIARGSLERLPRIAYLATLSPVARRRHHSIVW